MLPVFEWDVGSRIGEDYVPMVEDMLRVSVIQIVMQLLLSLVDPDNNPFFSGTFWLVLLYLMLGIVTYHALFRRVVCVT